MRFRIIGAIGTMVGGNHGPAGKGKRVEGTNSQLSSSEVDYLLRAGGRHEVRFVERRIDGRAGSVRYRGRCCFPLMRIARTQDRWSVLGFGHVVHDSLEVLALEEGYRAAGMCDRIGISEAYLRHLFLRDIGLGPLFWLQWERMVVARRLLCWERPCEEIAERLGFADCNSFRREFKRVYGIPPRQYFDTRFGQWRLLPEEIEGDGVLGRKTPN